MKVRVLWGLAAALALGLAGLSIERAVTDPARSQRTPVVPAQFASLRLGLTQPEVRAQLGPPADEYTAYGRRAYRCWHYRSGVLATTLAQLEGYQLCFAQGRLETAVDLDSGVRLR